MLSRHGRLATIGTLAMLAFAANARADTGLVAEWPFDEGAGPAAADASGHGNGGTLMGGAQWTAGRGNGSALTFDGSGGRVQVVRNASLEPATVSVSAWVRRSGTPGAFRYLVAKGATGCLAASYGLYTGPDGGLMFYVASDGYSFARTSDAGGGLWDGRWHHVAGTYDGSSVRMYLDGDQVGSGAPFSAPIGYGLATTDDVSIGSYRGCSGLDFDGSIDDPKIWSRALSPDEVAAQAAYPFRGFFSPVNKAPTLNSAKGGSAIPVKFSLGGNFGLGIMATASPSSRKVACSTGVPIDAIEETVTAGNSSLQYDVEQRPVLLCLEDRQELGRHLPRARRAPRRRVHAHRRVPVQVGDGRDLARDRSAQRGAARGRARDRGAGAHRHPRVGGRLTRMVAALRRPSGSCRPSADGVLRPRRGSHRGGSPRPQRR